MRQDLNTTHHGEAPRTVLYDQTINHTQKILYLILHRRQENYQKATVPLKQLAASLDTNRRTVIRHTLALEKAGFIEILRTPGEINSYRLIDRQKVYYSEEEYMRPAYLHRLYEVGEME